MNYNYWQYTLLLVVVFTLSCQNNTTNEAIEKGNKSEVNEIEPIAYEVSFKGLFEDVQLSGVFPDSKTFVDCTPRFSVEKIMENYTSKKELDGFDLKEFVNENFELPKQYASGFKTDTSKDIEGHIEALWDVLKRESDNVENASSLIPLPNEYIVPGGRFGEIYYWDSYFTMLGLEQSGRLDMMKNMIDNFSYIIDQKGFIPNGNRTYFNGRSQPPYYSMMVDLYVKAKKDEKILLDYLPQLQKEYDFWMNNHEPVVEGIPTDGRVVALPAGVDMNRYWDNYAAPRPESYREDVELAKESGRDPEEIYRDLRAACESGWDFSTRWFEDGETFSKINTTSILPVDLNVLLYHLEEMLRKGYEIKEDLPNAEKYANLSNYRKNAILEIFWDDQKGYFFDYNFIDGKLNEQYTIAGMYPLFLGIATDEQAEKAAKVIKEKFLSWGGVPATLVESGQQWDAPNGWAPLQWVTYKGLKNYGKDELAEELKDNWIRVNEKVYKNTGKMVEKYNVMNSELEAGGGEYPTQDGFGWSNGVLLKLKSE